MSGARRAASPVRVGLAGAGWVSRHHLEAWRRLSERAVVTAIADPDLDAARARAAEFGVPATYGSVDAMLAGETLDAIDVATPRETHAPICRLAADHGLAILCQKPLAPTLDQAEHLVRDLAGRVRLMVHENWRFRPHYRRIRQWRDDGRIGAVRTVVMTLLTSGLLPDAAGQRPAIVRQPMFATLDRLLLMEVLIHHVDTLRFLLGPLDLKGARLGKSCPVTRGEDRASLFLSTSDGGAVSLVGDFMAHDSPPEQLDRFDLYGTDGAVRLAGSRLQLQRAGKEPGAVDVLEEIEVDLVANYKASYVGTFTHFLDRLADGGPFETGPDDNLETLRIVEAAYRIGGGIKVNELDRPVR